MELEKHNLIKEKEVSLMEIRGTVTDVIYNEFSLSATYKKNIFFKIYAKLSVAYVDTSYLEIASTGGYSGQNYEMIVKKSCKKYDDLFRHDLTFQKIVMACKGRLHDSNSLEETYRETLLDSLNDFFEKLTDDRLQDILSFILKTYNGNK
jgi:hypothetical protein